MEDVYIEDMRISPCVQMVTAYLQTVYEAMESGTADSLLSDPFYHRSDGRPPLTDDEVDALIYSINNEYKHEILAYPQHHMKRSGANTIPDFLRLSPAARRTVAEGLDAIVSEYWDITKDPDPYAGMVFDEAWGWE